jgi:hypothetical protein
MSHLCHNENTLQKVFFMEFLVHFSLQIPKHTWSMRGPICMLVQELNWNKLFHLVAWPCWNHDLIGHVLYIHHQIRFANMILWTWQSDSWTKLCIYKNCNEPNIQKSIISLEKFSKGRQHMGQSLHRFKFKLKRHVKIDLSFLCHTLIIEF